MARARLAVLVSGRGSNLESLLAACAEGRLDAEIVHVISDKPDAPALALAKKHGASVAAIPVGGVTRDEHDARVSDAIAQARADLVILAGYMRILGAPFIARHRGRLLNIHPSLLPAFPGLDAQGQAHRARVSIAGCSVHFVTEKVDAGPIVAQAALAVDPAWSAEELRARILQLEHALYPAAIQLVLSGKARLEGDIVIGGWPAPSGSIFSVEVRK